jgi:hypothetical protein
MASLLKKLGGYKTQSDKPPLRPKAVLLDINGTLFPATAAAPAFKELAQWAVVLAWHHPACTLAT